MEFASLIKIKALIFIEIWSGKKILCKLQIQIIEIIMLTTNAEIKMV